MFLYAFPAFLDIKPHLHHRTSKVEMVFDILMTTGWIVAATQILLYAKCPSQYVNPLGPSEFFQLIDNSTRYCPTLVSTITAGYLTAIFFVLKIMHGIRNNITEVEQHVGKNIMYARGTWKVAKE
jgi:hypothetical protein